MSSAKYTYYFFPVGPIEWPLGDHWHSRASPVHTATFLQKPRCWSHGAFAKKWWQTGKWLLFSSVTAWGTAFHPHLEKQRYTKESRREQFRGPHREGEARSGWGLQTQIYLLLDSSDNTCGSVQDQQQVWVSSTCSGCCTSLALGTAWRCHCDDMWAPWWHLSISQQNPWQLCGILLANW